MVLVLFAFFRGAKRMLVSLPGSERGITVTFRGEVPRNNPVHPRHSSSGSQLPTPMCPPCRPGHGQHRGSQPEPSPLHPAQRPSPGRWVRILEGVPPPGRQPARRHPGGGICMAHSLFLCVLISFMSRGPPEMPSPGSPEPSRLPSSAFA